MIASAILARFKRACRSAVQLAGGIDGAAASVDKSRSLVGSWNNRNTSDMPTLGDAFALDEIAVVQGERPPIVSAMAAELGGMLIMLPEGAQADGELGLLLMDVMREAGELADTSRRALSDGKVDGREPAEIEAEADDVIERLLVIRAYARRLQGKDAVSVDIGARDVSAC